MKAALLALTLFASLAARADGIQVCVDSKGSTYTAHVTGFAKAHTDWSALLEGKGAIPPGTDLNKITFKGNLADIDSPTIEDLSFDLKHRVAPSIESLQETSDYQDEPRVYEAGGVDLVCSSTMSQDEYASLAK
jgi:hypothetical protein